VAEKGLALKSWEPVTPADSFTEAVLMGLRLTEGIDLHALEIETGQRLPAERIASLASSGLLAWQGSRLSATPHGRLVLNAILKTLLS
jgi:oxygen-independent coproporphyrinogen-3 oxidase